jgi:hypothetical protein
MAQTNSPSNQLECVAKGNRAREGEAGRIFEAAKALGPKEAAVEVKISC